MCELKDANELVVSIYFWSMVWIWQVHAYERCNRVYNYTLDASGPVYITVGDGGNIEQIQISHADDVGQCPSPDANKPEYGGICPFNFSSGPAAGKFCWNQQPEWSAFRESSFGHGILQVRKTSTLLCGGLLGYLLQYWFPSHARFGNDLLHCSTVWFMWPSD